MMSWNSRGVDSDELQSSYELEVSYDELEVSSYDLEVSSDVLEVSSYELEVSSDELEVSSYEFEVSFGELEVCWVGTGGIAWARRTNKKTNGRKEIVVSNIGWPTSPTPPP